MDSVYAEAYPDLYRNHWWWRAREAILLKKIAALLEHTPRARLLDVGCGAGLFFDALQRFGDVEGIESDAIAIESAGEWRGRIHHGELDESFRPPAPYDLILMLDVLEHLNDPVQLLRRAAPLLNAGGRILITVPAFNWLWTRHDDINHHVQRYTATAMRRTIVTADLVPIECSYLFQSLVIPKALVRVREGLVGGSETVPDIPPPAINKMIQAALRTEYQLAWWLPFGTSVMAVARRGNPDVERR
jgi:trans-aconitate methyltransferase